MKYIFIVIGFVINGCVNNHSNLKNESKGEVLNIGNDSIYLNNDTILILPQIKNIDSIKLKIIAIEKFRYKKELGNKTDFSLTIDLDDSIVEVSETNGVYKEVKREIDSRFMTIKAFHKKTLILKSAGKYFARFPIGIHKNYNSKGTLIDSIDYDEPFKFSIFDLKIKMQNEFKLDIFSKNRMIQVHRTNKTKPIYIVLFPITNEVMKNQNLVIDGITGEIIQQEVSRAIK